MAADRAKQMFGPQVLTVRKIDLSVQLHLFAFLYCFLPGILATSVQVTNITEHLLYAPGEAGGE